MSSDGLQNSGIIHFDEASKGAVGVAIAGVLAECGVMSLVIEDPRMCQRREVACREANLPREIDAAAAGTVFRGEGVAVLVDERCVRWVGGDVVAEGLRKIVVSGI